MRPATLVLFPIAALLGACATRENDAIIAQYDTFGSSESTGESSSSTSTTGTGSDSGEGPRSAP